MNLKSHRIVVFLAALLFWSQGAVGQESWRITGEVGSGGRILDGKRASSKFQEYREIPSGLFLDYLRLNLERDRGLWFAEFKAREAGEEDQSFGLRFGSLGRLEFEIAGDRLPHGFSNTGRTLFTRPSPNVFAFPDRLQSAIQAAPAANRGAILRDGLQDVQPIGLRFRQQTGTAGATFSPHPDWSFGARYQTTTKDGSRPLGVGFGSPGGTMVEIFEPIETRTSEWTASAEFARERYQVQLGYTASIFENDFPSVILDSPLRAADAPTASSRGQIALPPDNIAHTLNLSGGVSLPGRSRLVANVSAGWRFQDEEFLPHTINAALANDSALVLPTTSPDAEVRTLVGNIAFHSRLLQRVNLNARYRIFDLENKTAVFAFPGHVVNDQSLTREVRRSVPHEYRKQNAGADLSFRPLDPLSLKVGYEWERWDRDAGREVAETNEHTVKGVADLTPWSWLLLRGSYARSWKDGSPYNTFAHLAHTVPEEELDEAIPTSQFPELRKFDEADRDRDRVTALAQITPLEDLSLTAAYNLTFDDYRNSSYGVTEGRTWNASLDATYSISPSLSLFGHYTREELKSEQRSRYRARSFTAPVIVFNFPDFDWVSRNLDIVDTYGAGLDAALLPDRLDLGLNYSLSIADENVNSFNPVTPTSGTAAQRTSATPGLFPTRSNKFHQLSTTLQYHLTTYLSAELDYLFERYTRKDFAIENIQPFMGDLPANLTRAAQDVFLGADVPKYTAHIVQMALRYKF